MNSLLEIHLLTVNIGNENPHKCHWLKSTRKVVPTKTTIKEKYVIFFNTVANDQNFVVAKPEEKANIMHKFIYIDCAESRENVVISMCYNKEFKENIKNLIIQE